MDTHFTSIGECTWFLNQLNQVAEDKNKYLVAFGQMNANNQMVPVACRAECKDSSFKTKEIAKMAQSCFEHLKTGSNSPVKKRALLQLHMVLQKYASRVESSLKGRWWYPVLHLFGYQPRCPQNIKDLIGRIVAKIGPVQTASEIQVESEPLPSGSKEIKEYLMEAAHSGNIKRLEMAKQKGVFTQIDKAGRQQILESAASGGSIEVVKWARNNRLYKGYMVDRFGYGSDYLTYLCLTAAKAGQLPMVKWLLQASNDESYTEENGYDHGGFGVSHWQIANAAIWGGHQEGHFEVLTWAYRSCNRPTHIQQACKADNLDVVKWIHAKGENLNRIYDEARSWHSPAVLKWTHEMGSPLCPDFCQYAAQKGDLKMLQWGHAHGGSLDQVCSIAARRGDLAMLNWAKANGAPAVS